MDGGYGMGDSQVGYDFKANFTKGEMSLIFQENSGV